MRSRRCAVALDHEEFGVHAKWLTADTRVLALVSTSIDDAVRPPRDLQIGLGAITALGLLAYLKRLPVDELKIDKSFVMSMEKDLDDAKIVRSTIDLAHNLGLRVVAEGVENAKAWDMLRELECDEAQGYHMGRPMPAADFIVWSAAWLAKHPGRAATAPSLMFH